MYKTLKGIVTKLPEEGSPGTIQCSEGQSFSFSQKDTGSYRPLVDDVVTIEVIEDQVKACHLFYRKEGISDTGASVDLKVPCPYCARRMMPKARVNKKGQIIATICPFCGHELEKIKPVSKSFPYKAILLLGLLFVFGVLLVYL